MSTSSSAISGYEIGEATADFYLKNVDNTMVSMSNYEDARGFILIFTCNHCPYSVAYEDRIIALDQKYKQQGYPVIAINPNDPVAYPDDSFQKMQERAKQKGFTFPYLFDAQQKIYPKYGATKTPHVFIVEKEGDQTILRYKGAIDDNYQDAKAVKNKYVENAVNALISDRPVEVAESVAIGCRIK
nr:thioredoxin family protein [Nonlabens xiamenensis]